MGRLSASLVILGLLSLFLPTLASASKGQARQAKARRITDAKKSKEKMAVQRGQQKRDAGGPRAAGHLPRPKSGETTGPKNTGPKQGSMLAAALTPAASRPAASTGVRTPKSRRPISRRKATPRRTTRRLNPRKRRAARTTTSSRRRAPAQEVDAAAEVQAQAEAAALASRQSAEPPSRFRRILRRAGRALAGSAKYMLVVAAPVAVLAAGFTIVGGATVMGIGFAIAAPVVMLGIPMIIGLREQAAKQAQGIDDPQAELLQRYMGRRMLENHDLNGPGPGGGNVSGAGGINSLNNMIDPGGMR